MNTIEYAELEILKEIMNGIPAKLPAELDWNELIKELDAQKIISLVYIWVKKHGINNEDLEIQWKRRMVKDAQRWYCMMDSQRNILKLLADNNHKVVVMKGSANAALFPKPEVRYSNDIDMLVEWEEYDAVYELLMENGYELYEEKNDKMHHFEVIKDGFLFEIHRQPGGTKRNGARGGWDMIHFFQEGVKEPDHIKVYRYDIPVFPKLHNGMMLLIHTAGHMNKGLGIRHLLDWMVYVDHYLNDTFWEKKFLEKAQIAGLDSFAKILTRTCQIYLGLNDQLAWCKDVDDETCKDLMDYLLMQGDFGSKAGEEDNETRLFAQSEGGTGFLQKWNESSLYSMPIARKNILLRPVAWGYQGGRYIYKGLKREHPLQELQKNQNAGKERNDLFRRLGL